MRSLFLLTVLCLAGCATQQSAAPAGPPAYREGYAPGCDSGLAAGGNPYYRLNKDPQRYIDDAMYKQGWDDGFAQCKGRYDAIGQALH